jgi:peptidyl-prolyl cis-trans isomerase C
LSIDWRLIHQNRRFIQKSYEDHPGKAALNWIKPTGSGYKANVKRHLHVPRLFTLARRRPVQFLRLIYRAEDIMMIATISCFGSTVKHRYRPALRRIVNGALLAFCLGSGMAAANDQISVGTVNGEDIWLADVLRAAERLPEEFQQAPLENYFSQLVADIIDSKLAATAARTDAFDQKPEIAEAMAMAANRVLAESWLAEKVRSEITETAIQNAYDKFVADTASREQVTASHILVETETEATALITALQQGADFAELAKEKSTGPSGPNGGALGTFGRGQMVPAFETAAFNLEAGSVSETPVQTQFGWHVIKVESKEIAQAPDLQDMRAQLANNLTTQTLSRILEELRARQDIQLRSFAEIRTDAMNTAQ